MINLTLREEDILRFITGFELKHGRGPSSIEVADGQFDGDVAIAEGVIRALIGDCKLRRNFATTSSKLHALTPLPVPRSPFGEPLHFIRTGGPATW